MWPPRRLSPRSAEGPRLSSESARPPCRIAPSPRDAIWPPPLNGALPKSPKGSKGSEGPNKGLKEPKGAFGPVGPIGPLGVLPKPFRMEGHSKWKAISIEGPGRGHTYYGGGSTWSLLARRCIALRKATLCLLKRHRIRQGIAKEFFPEVAKNLGLHRFTGRCQSLKGRMPDPLRNGLLGGVGGPKPSQGLTAPEFEVTSGWSYCRRLNATAELLGVL